MSNELSSEMMYLAYTAMLTAALWVPYIVGQVMTNGFLLPENYRDPTPRPVPIWAQRANRMHINAVEVFAPFAALLLIANSIGLSTELTVMCAAIFFWARVGHAIVYAFGVPYLRTLIFATGFFAEVGIFYELICR